MSSQYFLNRLTGFDIVTKNGNELRIEPLYRLFIIAFMTHACLLLYFTSSYLFFTFSKSFRDLPKKEKMFWNLAIVRGVYGFSGSLCSAYERYFDEGIS